MKDKVERLHQLRQEQAANTIELRESKSTWDIDNMHLTSKAMELIEDISKLELRIKAERIHQYNGYDKSPLYGIGLREKTILNYIDQDAYNWALEHKLCLKLDTKSFEKIAKDGKIDFVTVEKELQATIASDLSKWLEGDNE